MREVSISKRAATALQEGFLWIYKSEIVDKKAFIPGELVRVVDERGKFLANGYINPQSTIAVRVLSFKDEPIDRAFFARRIKLAMKLRNTIFSNAHRVVHSEADFLPGLIIDRYANIVTIHFQTLGMVHFKEEIVSCIHELLHPNGLVIASDAVVAKKEGFEPFLEVFGEVERCIIEEHGVKFWVDVLQDQKTGFYLDQRRNREIVTNYLPKGATLLDCFSNTGGFGLYGAVKKEAKVRLVDISQRALKRARQNFTLNGVEGEFVEANVFDYLRQLRGKERFDMVVLDPPSFAKSRAQKEGAMRGFKDIAVNGMKLVKEGGLLALFSCSHHIGMEDLKAILLKAAKDNRKRLVVKEHLFQDHDHPILLNMPPTHYLNGVLCQVFDV